MLKINLRDHSVHLQKSGPLKICWAFNFSEGCTAGLNLSKDVHYLPYQHILGQCQKETDFGDMDMVNSFIFSTCTTVNRHTYSTVSIYRHTVYTVQQAYCTYRIYMYSIEQACIRQLDMDIFILYNRVKCTLQQNMASHHLQYSHAGNSIHQGLP